MNKSMIDDVAMLAEIASKNGIKDGVFLMSRSAYMAIQTSQDRFGIYRQRRLMKKAIPSVVVCRGDEWWHPCK